MPDPNKLLALSEIGYQIYPACGNCVYANFSDPCGRSVNYGTCQLQDYQHLKHTTPRKVSIHRSGSCPRFKMREETYNCLKNSGFDIFINNEPPA